MGMRINKGKAIHWQRILEVSFGTYQFIALFHVNNDGFWRSLALLIELKNATEALLNPRGISMNFDDLPENLLQAFLETNNKLLHRKSKIQKFFLPH
jgi:hypothetical protein